MFVDDIDYLSIGYWYNDAQEYVKEINNTLGGI